jgi:hypothetical protein
MISDVTPTYTTYFGTTSCAVTQSAGTVTSSPADGSAGGIVNDVGNLAPGATATLSFCVRINQ